MGSFVFSLGQVFLRGDSFLLKSGDRKVNVLQLVEYRPGGVEQLDLISWP